MRAMAACLKQALTDAGTGDGGGRSGGTPHAVAYDRTQAFWSSHSCGNRSSPIRPRASLIASWRSSASRINSGSLQMTILDGRATPAHSKPAAVPAASVTINKSVAMIRIATFPRPTPTSVTGGAPREAAFYYRLVNQSSLGASIADIFMATQMRRAARPATSLLKRHGARAADNRALASLWDGRA
jgi:hypothetical protein